MWQNFKHLVPPFDWYHVVTEAWTGSALEDTLWVTGMGTLVAWACGLVGCFLILRRMAMVGDAISHTVLPGLVVAFLIAGTRGGWVMFAGAIVAGLITIWLIEMVHGRSLIKQDAAIGICFSSLFAVGVLLVTRYASKIDLDADCVLYGEIGFTAFAVPVAGIPEPVFYMGIVTALVFVLLAVFYRRLLVTTFDPGLARSLGIRTGLYHYGLMAMLAVVVVAAFKAVGAILVVAMLIIPGATAYLLSTRLPTMLGLTLVHGLLSSVGGFHLARWLNCSTGAAMVVFATGLFVLAWIGVVAMRSIQRARSRHHHDTSDDPTVFTRPPQPAADPHPVRGTER
ncbi:metal ABC transporter permease [Sulfuriroseicoccus oceanibius]|uniref:Metal ABC transporter permease n=1 Tax=Sulfuriroseicoccus oceanibius TaxID=2707525 RepID=A0A6B3LF69_9BACT|nr:metal ABC transporter permease [Sulfuriroseicoccus oceanibius]QQL45451.1 metal ABC transporter permease [Sulfuriroseicoccus oceanibius]